MADKKDGDLIWLAIGGLITLGLTLLGIKNQSTQTTSTPTPAPSHIQRPPHHKTPPSATYHHDVSNIAYGSSYNTRQGDCGCGL